jgi:hypothetical protein
MMEAVMEGIGKQAEFYRAYLPHNRGLAPIAVAMGAVLAVGLFLYLVGAVSPVADSRMADASARAAAVLLTGPVSH